MRIGRIILAFLVSAALAMLPMAAAFAVPTDEPAISDVAAPAHEGCDHQSIASDVVVASAHDCCDHASMPADHMMKECHASAGCTAKCFSSAALVFSEVAIASPTGGTESSFASNPFCSQTASPPYRPPRA